MCCRYWFFVYRVSDEHVEYAAGCPSSVFMVRDIDHARLHSSIDQAAAFRAQVVASGWQGYFDIGQVSWPADPKYATGG